jgi:pentapeptide MXKDX repeat protein
MTMKTRLLLAAAIASSLALAPAAFAMDDMHKEGMSKGKMEKKKAMAKHKMKKSDGMMMKKDEVKKDEMKK